MLFCPIEGAMIDIAHETCPTKKVITECMVNVIFHKYYNNNENRRKIKQSGKYIGKKKITTE